MDGMTFPDYDKTDFERVEPTQNPLKALLSLLLVVALSAATVISVAVIVHAYWWLAETGWEFIG